MLLYHMGYIPVGIWFYGSVDVYLRYYLGMPYSLWVL